MTVKPASSLGAILLAVLAVLAIGLGLWVTGGPQQGRMEQRDETRLEDLFRLSAHVICLAQDAGDTLPASLDATATCPDSGNRDDPLTGAPYAYEVLNARSFRLCAAFETDLPQMSAGYDVALGCLVSSLPQD